MKKTIYLAIMVIVLSSCSIFENKPSPDSLGSEAYKSVMAASYETANITAQPDEETFLELSDGAAVFVPAASAGQDLQITLERNPEKVKKLPPLGGFTVPVSSFYDVQSGQGLNGPIEIQLPIDKSLIPPDMTGSLAAYAPDGKGGWNWLPVDEVDGKAVLITDNPGDPIIAWNFDFKDVDQAGDLPPTALDILRSSCKKKWWMNEEKCVTQEFQKILDDFIANTPLCDKRITLSVIPVDGSDARVGSQLEIIGRLRKNSIHPGLLGAPANVMENVPVEITLNQRVINENPKTYNATTDSEGIFRLTVDSADSASGFREGWNWIFANAACPSYKDKKEAKMSGYAEFKLLSGEQLAAQPETPNNTPTESPAGAVAVPDVVGLSLDEAVATLEALGFRTTWMDGKSTRELGRIYKQEPAAGRYFIPNRTTLLVYRTNEVVAGPPECAQYNLTLEECANSGIHQYTQSWTTNSEKYCPIGDQSPINFIFGFSNNNVAINLSDNGWKYTIDYYSKVIENTYSGSGKGEFGKWNYTFTFFKDGLAFDVYYEYSDRKIQPDCHYAGILKIIE